jgi:hypothetical protein
MTVQELTEIKEKFNKSDGYVYISMDGKHECYVNEIQAYMSNREIYTNNPNEAFNNYTTLGSFAEMSMKNADLLEVFIKALTYLNH